MDYKEWVERVGQVIDLLGVAVIAVGVVLGLATYLWHIVRHRDRLIDYRELRLRMGKAILLGLELLVAGDIIRTVATNPTFASVGVLAAIVAVRTFLSFTMLVELDGRWPWQSRSSTSSTLPNDLG